MLRNCHLVLDVWPELVYLWPQLKQSYFKFLTRSSLFLPGFNSMYITIVLLCFLSQTHMIVTVPEYSGQAFTGTKVACQVIVNSGSKLSDSQPFFYKAGKAAVRYLVVTSSHSPSRTLSSCEWLILSVMLDLFILISFKRTQLIFFC